MLPNPVTSFDSLTRRLIKKADLFVDKIPRRVFEGAFAIISALVVFWLFNKNIYFGIGAVVALFAALFLITKPILLIYTAFAFIPITWVNLLGRRFRVLTFLTLLALAYYLFRAIAKKVSPPKEPLFWAYVGYVAICAISLINSVSISASLTSSKYFILSLMFAFALVLAIEDKKHLKVLIWIILGWGAILSILSLLQSIVSIKFYPAYYFHVFGIKIVEQYSVQGIRRASGTFESGPRYAMYLLGPVAITLAAIWSDLDKKRALWIGLLMLYIMGLMMSFTRAAMLLGTTYVFLYNIFERRWKTFSKSFIWVALIAVVAMSLIYFLIPADVTNAMVARFETEDDEMYLDRFTFLYNALMAFKENPIVGLGIGTYTLHSWNLMQKYPVPWQSLSWDVDPLSMPQNVPVHNDYGRMLAETGFFSLFFFILIYIFSFKNYLFVIKKTKDKLYRACAVSFAMYLGVMIPYWFFHEYIMVEPYASIIPVVMSVVLKKLTLKEISERQEESKADDLNDGSAKEPLLQNEP